MNISVFKDQLETLGADFSKWPPSDAEAALQLLSTSTQAQDLFARVSAEELALFGDKAGDASALVERILGDPARKA